MSEDQSHAAKSDETEHRQRDDGQRDHDGKSDDAQKDGARDDGEESNDEDSSDDKPKKPSIFSKPLFWIILVVVVAALVIGCSRSFGFSWV